MIPNSTEQIFSRERTKMENADKIRTDRERLEMARRTITDFDGRIAVLKRELDRTAPRERRPIELQVADLQAQRANATALTEEAEQALAQSESDHANFVAKVRADLEALGADVAQGAKQFDDACAAVVRALAAIEDALRPLEAAGFLAGGIRSALRRNIIESAFRRAFGARFGDIAASEASMSQHMQLVIAAVRQNAAKKKEDA
jgi:hypothetical protein